MASALSLGSVFTLRTTLTRDATAANASAVAPAKPNAARNPRCSPSQPPKRAPGPAGNKMSQRMVLVMRPKSRAGVTDCRSDRKLMNMKTAPTPYDSSMQAYAATPMRFNGATASASQPQPLMANPSTSVGPGPRRRTTR